MTSPLRVGHSIPIACPPGPLVPRLDRRSRRSSRRRSRSGPRKFEKLYVDVADELGRRPIGRRVAAAPRAATRIIRGRTAGRAENDPPKTALNVHVDPRRIKARPTIGTGIITYVKSLYLDIRLIRGTRAGRPKIIPLANLGDAATFDPWAIGPACQLRQRKESRIYAGPNATSDVPL